MTAALFFWTAVSIAGAEDFSTHLCSEHAPEEIAPQHLLVPRAFIEQWLANDSNPLTGHKCTIFPAFKDGRPIGLKQFGIGPDDARYQLGLRNGDVLTRINSGNLANPDDLQKILQFLESQWKTGEPLDISMSILRNGEEQTLYYSVR